MALSNIFCDCDCTSVFLFGISFSLAFYWLRQRKQNFPPGPTGLPFLGYAPFVADKAGETFLKLKGKYGPVMSIPLGMKDWVVLNDFDSINECLVKQGERFSGRPKNRIIDEVSMGKGVIMIDYGETWKDLRKFGASTLRGFGVGKKGMEENVIEELPYLLDELVKDNRNTGKKLTNAVSNIICRVILGSRYDYDDDTFSALTKYVREFFSSSTDAKLFGIIAAAPSLRYFPIFHGAYRRILRGVNNLKDILRRIIEEHKATFDMNNVRDFIDAFLAKMHRRGLHDESFEDDQLVYYIRDIFEAGTGTSSTTLTWGLLVLVNKPECQTKIADEIHDVIGDSGTPSMKQRDEMNYTCAFIHELMRHRTLAPTAVMHKTNEKAYVNGYTIPKDTTIIPNIWAVHHDPDVFENPEDFKPERFLDENGKFVKSNHVIPFSVGPRHCLGEQLGRMEVFIFLTGIIQKLKIHPDPLHPPPPITSGCAPFFNTYEPPDFQVVFERR